jgi:hypothetical protein
MSDNTIKKILNRAMSSSVSRHEQARNFYVYTVPHGHTVADLVRPEYWSNESKKFLLADRIEFRAEDMSFWAEGIVVGKGNNSVKIKIRDVFELSDENEKFSDEVLNEYKIMFRGLKGHSVVRKSDNHVISEGHDSEADAKKALAEFIKAMQK